MRLQNLTEIQFDALRETGSIGAGHAATALSQLVGHGVMIDVPTLEIVHMREVPYMFGGPEVLVGAVYARILGDLPGGMLFVATRPALLTLVDMMRHRPTGTAKSVGAEEEALVTHVASVLCAAYLAAIGRLADLSLLPSRPEFSLDMSGAILQTVTAETGVRSEAVLQRTRFLDDEVSIDSCLFFLPDPEQLEVLLARLGLIR